MSMVAYELDSTYSIMTRVGLHCAPSAHKTFSTYPSGTIRFSFGPKNTSREVETTLDATEKNLFYLIFTFLTLDHAETSDADFAFIVRILK